MERWWPATGDPDVMAPDSSGEWVRYDDAQRAVAEAEAGTYPSDFLARNYEQGRHKGYGQGQRDERARIRAAVEAMTAGRERMEYDEDRADQVAAHNAYIDCVCDVLAVIDADGES